jgi:divalent metal cation (Fe/Co/Zn/Cd) transporter
MALTEPATHFRIPTPAQYKQERALALVLWLDLVIVPPYFVVGMAAGSLATIAESLRGLLLLIVVGVSLRTLRRSHRGLLGQYDYGTGKLERALSGAVAVLLLIAVGFVMWRTFIMQPYPLPSRLLAGLAILFACLNLGANTIPLVPLLRSMRGQPSLIVLSLYRARVAKAVSSVIVVTGVTIHALASDPMIGRIAETVGAVIVAGMMTVIAIGLLREALPDLLDRALAEPMQLQVNRTLAAFFHDYEEVIAVRTRRSGRIAHVEIILGFAPDKSMGELSEFIERMQVHLQQAIPGCDIVIVPRTTRRHFTPASTPGAEARTAGLAPRPDGPAIAGPTESAS